MNNEARRLVHDEDVIVGVQQRDVDRRVRLGHVDRLSLEAGDHQLLTLPDPTGPLEHHLAVNGHTSGR